MTIDDLLQAGYREYQITYRSMFNEADRFFQKIVWGDDAKLYFLNAYYYDFRQRLPEAGESFMFEVTFFRVGQNGSITWRVRLNVENLSVADVEAFFAAQYADNQCVPDLHNN